jgi:hypothetical protein
MSPSTRLAKAVGGLLERRTSRRGVLARAAVAGSAFAVAPVRYLIRPGTAEAVLYPSQCGPNALCNDGYTAFCCEIEAGLNTCPENTYVAGWWKCTDYRGSGLCHGQGYRYYVDCNRIPGHHFAGTTEVACRLVLCQNPSQVPGMNCNATEMVDDRTCSHEAGCLEGLATPLPGGGGA